MVDKVKLCCKLQNLSNEHGIRPTFILDNLFELLFVGKKALPKDNKTAIAAACLKAAVEMRGKDQR